MGQTGRSAGPPGAGGMALFFAVFAGLGFPLVYEIWETINELLTGNVGAVRWGWFVSAILGLGVLLAVLARVLRRWSAET